jgi:tight adherence protein C
MNEQLVIPVLTGASVIAIGGSLILNRWARRQPLEQRLAEISGVQLKPRQSQNSGILTGVVQNVGERVASRGASVTLREHLTQAGYHGADAAFVYMGAKILLLLAGLLGSAILILPTSLSLTNQVLLIGLITAAFFMIPNLIVASKRSSRSSEIRRHLPDAIDLLEICASAGMGLDQAWNSVADEVRSVSPMLADEMALTNLEIHLGASRTDAMRHMATRTGADELSSLVAMLLQAERFGTSIAEGLQTYATFMRETRSQRAQEQAEKMAIKLIFPMVIAIFPAVVMLMAGPAFIQLYKATRPG